MCNCSMSTRFLCKGLQIDDVMAGPISDLFPEFSPWLHADVSAHETLVFSTKQCYAHDSLLRVGLSSVRQTHMQVHGLRGYL